jgi:hypothetical protein
LFKFHIKNKRKIGKKNRKKGNKEKIEKTLPEPTQQAERHERDGYPSR